MKKLNIDFIGLMVGSVSIILLTNLTHYLDLFSGSYHLYFSFSAFIYQTPYPLGWDAITVKLLLPVIGGVLVSFIVKEDIVPTAACAGFLAAFIQTWPAVIDWDRVAPPGIHGYRYVFLSLFFLYFIAYYNFGKFGGRAGVAIKRVLGRHNIESKAIIKEMLDYNTSIKPLLIGLIVSIISFVISSNHG